MKNLTKLILSAWGLAGLQAYANLVQNPGFETGDFTGWTVSGDISAFAGSAHSGTYSAAFDDAISAGFLDQNIATTPGDVYDISFWLFSDTQGGINVSGSFGSDTFYLVNNLHTGSYTEVTANNVSATGSSTALHLTFQDIGSVSFGALDDISVTDVTPAGLPDVSNTTVLLLLALAGLAGFNLRFRHSRRSLAPDLTSNAGGSVVQASMCHAPHYPGFKFKTTMKRPLAIVFSIVTLAGAQAYANLVQNPGFETGDFTGWTIGNQASFDYGSSVLSTDPHSGTHSAFLEAAPGTATLSQTIPVTAGDVYDVSFWLATVSGDGSSFGAYFAGVLLLSGAGSGAGYNEYNYTGLAAGTGVISFSFARDDAFELDDISVTDVTPAGVPDAASTAGLLGLGLAGLLALRRRLGLPSFCPKTGS